MNKTSLILSYLTLHFISLHYLVNCSWPVCGAAHQTSHLNMDLIFLFAISERVPYSFWSNCLYNCMYYNSFPRLQNQMQHWGHTTVHSSAGSSSKSNSHLAFFDGLVWYRAQILFWQNTTLLTYIFINAIFLLFYWDRKIYINQWKLLTGLWYPC